MINDEFMLVLCRRIHRHAVDQNPHINYYSQIEE